MINWDKIDKKISIKKRILPLFVVILILLFTTYFVILRKQVQKNIFASNMESILFKNENPVFSIDKIYLCSSANAVNSNNEQDLSKLDLYQYTDIAIYLKRNGEELTSKNTIKELYIDNIELELEDTEGQASLVYTNLLKIGSKEEIKNIILSGEDIQKEKIEFNIINTNNENNTADYEKPSFYADCSNPISLKYMHKINKKYSIGKNNSAIFDGSILKKAGVKIEDLNARIKFKINILNNEKEYYSAWINFKLPLNDIYQGTSIKSRTTVGTEYNFFTL